MGTSRILLAVISLSAVGLSSGAHSNSLDEALIGAYQNNPALNAARSGSQASKEEISIANSARKPMLTADASGSAVNSDGDSFERGIAGIQAEQLLFDGQATHHLVQAVTAQAAAANQEVAIQVQNTLLSAATAFYDVYRDRKIVEARDASLEFLSEQVSRAESLFTVGEGTRTDISLAAARQAAADAEASLAKAQLSASESSYIRTIGVAPTDTVLQSPLSSIGPNSLSAAIDLATSHPAIVNSKLSVEAAQANARLSRSASAPRVSLNARLEHAVDSFTTGDPREQDGLTASLGVRLNFPLYQGGAVKSRNRQADYSLEQALMLMADTRAQVESNVTAAWTRREAAQKALDASTLQLQAAQAALNGVVEEKEVGLRTTLDVLTVQQDVLNAQIRVSTAQRDSAVSEYTLLASVGLLNPVALSLDVGDITL